MKSAILKSTIWFVAAAISITPAFAQGLITTVAGTDWLFPGDGRPAINAPLSGLSGMDLATDRNGNYYIADYGNFMVMRVGPDGIVNVIAGNGVNFVSGDGGLAVNAAVPLPTAVAVDAAGDVFIAQYNSLVRKVTPDGIINTFAGNGNDGFAGDGGPATQALLNAPHGLAVDSAGNVYISDTQNNRVRKVAPDGTMTTVAGNGNQGVSGDGLPATSVPLNNPTRIAVDSSGNLFIIEFLSPDLVQSPRIRKVDTKGIITTVIGGSGRSGVYPLALTVDAAGNVYFVDTLVQGVREIPAVGRSIVTTLAGGSGASGFAGDGGPAGKAIFSFQLYPSIAIDSSGNILVVDEGNERVRAIKPDRTVNTVAGNGLFYFSGDGGQAVNATLYTPTGVIGDSNGNLFVSEAITGRVRRVAPDGTISVYAGNGAIGDLGDNGPAASAELNEPMYMTFAPDGSLLVAEYSGCVIRRIDLSGIAHTFAGTHDCKYGGDGGPATAASFDGPSGMAFDAAGNLIVADTYNNRIRVILAPPDNRIITLAGNGKAGFSGDNGSALQSELNQPVGVQIANGGIYFSDYGNHRIRRIDLQSLTITTVAGTGTPGLSGDGGPATQAELSYPEGITFDTQGNLYIADSGNRLVRRIDTAGIITTFAGSKSKLVGDGGPATSAGFGSPSDVWVDAKGNVLIADYVLSRVRSVLATAPSFQVSTTSLAVTAPAGSVAVDQRLDLTGSIPGVGFTVTTPADSPWLQVSPVTGAMPSSLKVTVDPSTLSPGVYGASIGISAPTAQPPTRQVQIALTVAAPGQPSLGVKPTSLTFSFVQQSAPTTRTVTVSNAGGGVLPFSSGVATASSANWLSVTPGGGNLNAYASTPMNITADPTGLPPGTYSGTVTFSNASLNQSFVVPVTMTVTAVQQTMLIPQNGLTFYAVQGGGAPPPQFFNVLNTGVGQMPFTTSASTLTGGPWLSALPAAGLSDASSPIVPQLRVDVNPNGLSAGIYYGTTQVTAPSADNNPQFVSVILNVLPPGSTIGPTVEPSGLIYTAVAGGGSPSSQTVVVQSTGGPIGFSAAFSTPGNLNWLTPLPVSGTISPTQPARIVLQPRTGNLAPGVYYGTLTLSFSDGSIRTSSIVLVLVAAGAASPQPLDRVSPKVQSACVPSQLIPVFTQLSPGFSVSVGWPGQASVKVVDDCGNLMTSGSVNASFSNGDPSLGLISLKDGNWTATWTPVRPVSPVTVTADAAIPEQNLAGVAQVIVGLQSTGQTPIIATNGIVNAASLKLQAPVAPGSFISVFGSRMAPGPSSAPGSPLPATLGGTTLVVAGRAALLAFSSGGQVNAILPYGIAVNTTQQVIVSSGSSISVPQTVTVAAAAPGIFTLDGSGGGQGIILGVDAAGAQTIADASNPVHAGQTIVIYCTGLGEVNPPVPGGSATPLSPLSSTVNPVGLTVGGIPASVAFAGLSPGSTGLYQVNAVIPAGVGAGDAVPVVLTAAGQQSQAVTISVR